MTQKEKLYKEYVIAQNKVNALRGKELIGGENIEEYFNSRDFSYAASIHTKEELRLEICRAKTAYEDEVEKLRVENYFNTPEGAFEKANLTAAITDLEEKRKNLFLSSTELVNTFIKEWLGEEWGCGKVSSTSLQIGIVEKVSEQGWNCFYFGHSFDLYFGYFNEDRFEMNYGCMGAFKLLNDETGNLRAKYLLGMGMFATNKEKLQILKTMIDEHRAALHDLEKQLNVLEYNLSHPFDKRKVA